MIHAFAIEPELVASWGGHIAFEFVRSSFGLGSPRVMFEFPAFKNWRRMTWDAVAARGLPDMEKKRIEALLSFFSEHKYARGGCVYDGKLHWLTNAELEYGRRAFGGILAAENPRKHEAVLTGDQLSSHERRWACAKGASPARKAAAMVALLGPMLASCRVLHLIDPHFDPSRREFRNVLAAIMQFGSEHNPELTVLRLHCGGKLELRYFEAKAAAMAGDLPDSLTVEFARWEQRPGGEKFHNRYVLTDLGGVKFGIGLDEGEDGETDDVSIIERDVYLLRWSQYVEGRGFDQIDTPTSVRGTVRRRTP